jgi:hypothetical protein
MSVERALVCGKILMRITFLLSFILIGFSMDAQTIYRYYDGSANGYLVSKDSLTYDPVTPKESSTGTYSGGEPKSIVITAREFGTLAELFEKAIDHKESHQQDREKMTGLVIRDVEGAMTRVVLKRDAKVKHDLEMKLREFIAN